MTRLAIIGLGDMGSAHARGFDALPGCEVIATVDPNEQWQELSPVAWKRGAPPPHFRDTGAMLSAVRPDACVVAVPDILHRQVSETVMEAGCDLFLEKPVSTTLEDCDAILEMAGAAGRILQIGLVYRSSNLYRRMAKLSEEGGRPPLMWCKELRQAFPQRPWFYSQKETGGTLVEKDCHHFDLFNWMIGSEPVRVFATGGQHVWKSGTEISCDYCPDPPRIIEQIDTVDHALVTIDYENGAKASLILCMYLRPHNVMPEGLEVGGILASGRQMIAYRDERLGSGGLGDPLTFERIDMWSDNEGLGHIGAQEQRRDFLQSLQQRSEPFASGRVGRQSLLVALAAERSIREGAPINLLEYPPCPK